MKAGHSATRLFQTRCVVAAGLLFLSAQLARGNYLGVGTFTNITSLSDLTDGYYVMVASGTNAMSNVNAGSYFQNASVSPSSGTIVDPAASVVWLLETNAVYGGFTIYNEDSTKYVSYSGTANAAYAADAVSGTTGAWVFAYGSGVFSCINAADGTRILQYNALAPRFACYTSVQQKFLLYKLAGGVSNIPPVLQAIGSKTVYVTNSLQFNVTAAPTDGDAVALTASNLPSGAVFYSTNAAGLFVWPVASPAGTYHVTFNAADKDGFDAETVTISVETPPDFTRLWKFVVFGDSRGTSVSDQVNTNILAELAQAAISEEAEFVLYPGDLVFSGSAAAFAVWTNTMAPVYQAGIGVYTVMGNHDTNDVSAYLNSFASTVPDNGPAGELNRTYYFVHSNALIVALDCYATNLRINQTWLDGVLASNYMPHVFVLSHAPAFKLQHPDCLDDYASSRDVFWSSLEDAGVRAYFCSHDHFYDHARLDDGDGNTSNDVHQFIVATAGAPLYTDGSYNGSNGSWTPVRQYHEMANGYLLVEVNGLDVNYTWKHRVSAGVYETGSDAWNYYITPYTSWLDIESSSPTGLALRVQNVTPSANNDVEWKTDLMTGTWQPYMNFNTLSNTCLLNLSVTNDQLFFRVKSRR
ncbi:MAG: metallophosphoesterase [Kiritimatiellia bacterium]